MSYVSDSKKPDGCVFCAVQQYNDSAENLIVTRGKRTFVILNRFPYTTGHIMVIPFCHAPSLENLDTETRSEIMEFSARFIEVLRAVYCPEGFNLGINIGEVAGAGVVGHVHLHIVPRWVGDTNFMTAVGATRVLPESLEDSYERIRQAWEKSLAGPG